MLSLCIENSISFCAIILLLWFDFHRNILCLCYSIRSSPRLKSHDLVLTLFLFLNFCFSRFVSLGLQLSASSPIYLGFSCGILTEISQSPDLYYEFRFLTFQKKRAFRNDGLFHIIYAEESTNFFT